MCGGFPTTDVPTSTQSGPTCRPAWWSRCGPPGTWRYDTGRKREIYEQAGVGELWLVDTPHQTVIPLRRRSVAAPTFDVTVELGAGDAITSPLLDGFTMAVDSLFTD